MKWRNREQAKTAKAEEVEWGRNRGREREGEKETWAWRVNGVFSAFVFCFPSLSLLGKPSDVDSRRRRLGGQHRVFPAHRLPFLISDSAHWPPPAPVTLRLSATEAEAEAEAEGDSPARQMEMKRLCCFIAAIRKNEALFRCFKQTCCLPFPLPPISLSLTLFLSLSTAQFPHWAVANLIYMYFHSTFSSLLRARKLATGWAVASPSLPSPCCGMRQFPLQSPAPEIFALLLRPWVGAFAVYPSWISRAKSCGCTEMIAAFHFQLSRPAALPQPHELLAF